MNDYLMHFNQNHDPKNGQFAKSNGLSSDYVSKSAFKKDIVSDPKEKVEFHLRDNSQFAKILAKFLPGVRNTLDTAFSYDIKDKSGNTIGYMELERFPNDVLYGSWISINDEQQGRGYGQSAMRMVLNEARKNGFKKMTIEVPGISPDARHIYEKNGFVLSKDQYDLDPEDIWGGLTRMEQEL